MWNLVESMNEQKIRIMAIMSLQLHIYVYKSQTYFAPDITSYLIYQIPTLIHIHVNVYLCITYYISIFKLLCDAMNHEPHTFQKILICTDNERY